MAKQQRIRNNNYNTLLQDQNTLRSLHEQLYQEYEEIKTEQDQLKKANRDLRSEIRALKDLQSSLEKKMLALEQEKETLKSESKSFGNLRAEHSKLKVGGVYFQNTYFAFTLHFLKCVVTMYLNNNYCNAMIKTAA